MCVLGSFCLIVLRQPLSSVEKYDPSSDEWTLVSNMSVARYGASVAVLGDKLYVLGGSTDRSVATESCEVYDPITDTWSPIADMNVARRFAGRTKMSAAGSSSNKGVCTKDIKHDTKWLLKMKSILNDVTLCTDDGRQIKAHKCLLAAASEYFNAMFAGDMAEKHQSSVTLHDVSGEMVQLLIDYMYTGEMVVNEDNVQDLLVTADRVQMLAIRDECYTFLTQNLQVTNYMDMIVLAKRYSFQQLYDNACRYCKEYFSDISSSKSFSDLPMPTLIELISSEHLIVNSEEQVYHSVISWVKSDLDTRRTHLLTLLSYVRLPLLSKKFIVDEVKQERLITSDNECVQLLVDAMAHHLSEPSDGSGGCALKPRRQEHQAIFVYGGAGVNKTALNDGECYSHMTSGWTDFYSNQPAVATVGGGAAVIGDKLYIMCPGGKVSIGSFIHYSVHRHQFQRDQLRPDMVVSRSFYGVAVLSNKIYAAGGYVINNSKEPICSAEVFDPNLDEWRSIASLNVARMSLGLAEISGCLFAVGGGGIGQQPLSSVEKYDPSSDEWTLVSNMSVGRIAPSVAVLGDKLYVLGGRTDDPVAHSTKSCEVYDPTTDTWSPIADMNEARRFAGAIALNGQLYVCGGWQRIDKEVMTPTVERYDSQTNTWYMEASMTKPRAAFTITVAKHPPIKTVDANDVHQLPNA